MAWSLLAAFVALAFAAGLPGSGLILVPIGLAMLPFGGLQLKVYR